MQEIGFDRYIDESGKSGLGVFILLLGDECSYLASQDSHWLNHTNQRVFVVRLQTEDFRVLDCGVHPAVQFFYDGKEKKTTRGIISLSAFNQAVKDIQNEHRRSSRSTGKG